MAREIGMLTIVVINDGTTRVIYDALASWTIFWGVSLGFYSSRANPGSSKVEGALLTHLVMAGQDNLPIPR